MPSVWMDLWDTKTFDGELTAILNQGADLIQNYEKTEQRIFLEYDHNRRRPDNVMPRPQNSYASRFLALQEVIGQVLDSRTIRAWHYSRMTDDEVENLRLEGIHLSTATTLRSRLESLVASRELTLHQADALFTGSPFHSDQLEARSGKFWMTSHPTAIHDSGVEPLLARWGGEVAAFWTKDPELRAVLAALGKPKVIELAVPMTLTLHSYCAAKAVTAAFARTLGCVTSSNAIDLYVTQPLGPDSILRVHGDADPSFQSLGLDYPEGYIDVSIGYWKELTGEDD